MSSKLKAVIDESEKVHKDLTGKVGGAFTSSGGTASGGETTLLSIVQAIFFTEGLFKAEQMTSTTASPSRGHLRKKTSQNAKRSGKELQL
jgi:multimeric flavodoxin WrbA